MILFFALLFAFSPNPDYRALYESGTDFDTFMAQATRRRALWERNQFFGEIPERLLERARAQTNAAAGPTYLLAVAVDSCSDSVNTIPFLARLAAAVDGLELRIIPPSAGREIMEAHRTPDGRAATPTVVVLDAEFNEIGVFIERPAPLQEWAATAGADLDPGTFVQQKGEWYDADAGRTTVQEVVTIMEFANISSLLEGTFEDDYDYSYDISALTWNGPGLSSYLMAEWNSSEQYTIAEQVSTAEPTSEPNRWVRIDWMHFETMPPYTWGYCISTYNARTPEAARRGTPADRSNPRTGCNGHPFTRMQSLR